jgi:hypothetical protein
MEPYFVRLTISADSELETQLLEHLAAKRRASMANTCRDLLQVGLGRSVPATPLSKSASRVKRALKFELSPVNDGAVLAGIAAVAERDRHRWLRQTLLAGFFHHLGGEDLSAPKSTPATNATHATQRKESSSSAAASPERAFSAATKERPSRASVDIELPIDGDKSSEIEASPAVVAARPAYSIGGANPFATANESKNVFDAETASVDELHAKAIERFNEELAEFEARLAECDRIGVYAGDKDATRDQFIFAFAPHPPVRPADDDIDTITFLRRSFTLRELMF